MWLKMSSTVYTPTWHHRSFSALILFSTFHFSSPSSSLSFPAFLSPPLHHNHLFSSLSSVYLFIVIGIPLHHRHCFHRYFFSPFSHVLRYSTPRFVGPSVHRSICPSHFTFFGFLQFLASLLLRKWSGDLNYSPCPPARDWGSRVSGLVFLSFFFDAQKLLLKNFTGPFLGKKL